MTLNGKFQELRMIQISTDQIIVIIVVLAVGWIQHQVSVSSIKQSQQQSNKELAVQDKK